MGRVNSYLASDVSKRTRATATSRAKTSFRMAVPSFFRLRRADASGQRVAVPAPYIPIYPARQTLYRTVPRVPGTVGAYGRPAPELQKLCSQGAWGNSVESGTTQADLAKGHVHISSYTDRAGDEADGER